MSTRGEAANEPEELMPRWKASSKAIKECLNCVVFPIGSVSVGVCRHRALLFKVIYIFVFAQAESLSLLFLWLEKLLILWLLCETVE